MSAVGDDGEKETSETQASESIPTPSSTKKSQRRGGGRKKKESAIVLPESPKAVAESIDMFEFEPNISPDLSIAKESKEKDDFSRVTEPTAVFIVSDLSPCDLESKEKKAKRKRKAASAEEGVLEGKDKLSEKPSKKSKKEQLVEDFVMGQLPALRRSMNTRKKQQGVFQIREYSHYFDAKSAFTPTFLLPLFHFLGKNEITCTRYGQFDMRHMVKTTDGFNHVSFLMANCSLTEDEGNFLMKKFGKEWYKIPAKDQGRVATCVRDGDRGEFRIELVGIYEGSFRDDEGNMIKTINPSLRYYPVKQTKKEE